MYHDEYLQWTQRIKRNKMRNWYRARSLIITIIHHY